jgi:phosphatidylserine/phosphatidylglycerophosphate/cardiolipin synthase-like enzyme
MNCAPSGWQGCEDSDDVFPVAVWTGSFNPSENAERSFENAVELHDRRIAQAYYKEWSQLLALSEPLDWETTWSAPEWRIGS